MAGAQDHETVSGYPLDEEQLESLLTNARECALNWSTRDGWPVGVIHAYVWKDGRFWITCAVHRHRVAAIRRDPRVSVIVSSAACPPDSGAPGGQATAKGRCIIHDDQETKDWFYPALARKTSPDEESAMAFVERLDSPLRVIIEVIPEKWILFDGGKMAKDTAGTLTDEERGPLLSADAERMPKELAKRGLA
jgi:hypothetical protein